jgi:hypothetical protein
MNKNEFRRVLRAYARLHKLAIRTHSDVERLERLEPVLSAALRDANHTFFACSHAITFASRGVGTFPSDTERTNALRAWRRLHRAEVALGHSMYADYGRTTVARLIGVF